MKKLLCISPHFPPVNAADMHRLRQSLPYLRDLGWDPVVFTIDPDSVETGQDPMLAQTLPADLVVHRVGAVSSRLTRKVGLGNLGFRSWFSLRRAVDRYLRRNKVDLIFFSTTVFASIAHGPHWKRLSGAPFVVDLQDPWRNDYYLALPKAERPGKFWFDYAQKKRLEAATMPHADGLVAVSSAYIDTIHQRYPETRAVPSLTLPFGAAAQDVEIARRLPSRRPPSTDAGRVEIVYVGRGGQDMAKALEGLFQALADLRQATPAAANRLRFRFIGTSYAAAGRGEKSVHPIAQQYGVADLVREDPDRLPYFEALRALLDADALFIPGSDDPAYTASKIYPYILAGKPLLAAFHASSSAGRILSETGAAILTPFDAATTREALARAIRPTLEAWSAGTLEAPKTDWSVFERYSARSMTGRLTNLFDEVLGRSAAQPAPAPQTSARTA